MINEDKVDEILHCILKAIMPHQGPAHFDNILTALKDAISFQSSGKLPTTSRHTAACPSLNSGGGRGGIVLRTSMIKLAVAMASALFLGIAFYPFWIVAFPLGSLPVSNGVALRGPALPCAPTFRNPPVA
jgi:hypothetical protein